jgi:tRNA modification GTPase
VWEIDETIVAVASAPGPSMRGIVRACGPKVIECIEPHFRPREPGCVLSEVPSARRIDGALHLRALRQPLDVALFLWPKSRSFTRQPTVELHTSGSPPLLAGVADLLCASGARYANPGEFTLRAFLAGRLDLTQAEAVLGVIDAVERRQLDVALAQMAGGLARPLNSLRDTLVDLLAHLEAGLDFVDEDIEFVTSSQLEKQLGEARDAVRALAAQIASRSLADHAVRVVLFGRPNEGKSSLFNALLGQGHAIVSDVAGTTRDWLCGRLELDGVSCELIDTAGLDETAILHEIDRAAQASTVERQQQAHVAVHCVDATQAATDPSHSDESSIAVRHVTVWTKSDLVSIPPVREGIATSAITGLGLEALRKRLREVVLDARSNDCDVVAGTADRVRPLLHSAGEALEQAWEMARCRGGEELVAAELRLALDALGEIVGTVYADDILDRIFSRFCIGK